MEPRPNCIECGKYIRERCPEDTCSEPCFRALLARRRRETNGVEDTGSRRRQRTRAIKIYIGIVESLPYAQRLRWIAANPPLKKGEVEI